MQEETACILLNTFLESRLLVFTAGLRETFYPILNSKEAKVL